MRGYNQLLLGISLTVFFTCRACTRASYIRKKYHEQFKVVFDAIRALMSPSEEPRKKIGFKFKECRSIYGRKRKQNNK
jgi:hypothetical protein